MVPWENILTQRRKLQICYFWIFLAHNIFSLFLCFFAYILNFIDQICVKAYFLIFFINTLRKYNTVIKVSQIFLIKVSLTMVTYGHSSEQVNFELI